MLYVCAFLDNYTDAFHCIVFKENSEAVKLANKHRRICFFVVHFSLVYIAMKTYAG